MMNPDEIQQLIRETVHETLTGLGFDPDEPIEAQRDMQFIRDWRRASESVKSKALVTVIGILVCGTAGALILGLKTLILRP